MKTAEKVASRVRGYKQGGFKPLREWDIEEFRKICRSSYINVATQYPDIVSHDVDNSNEGAYLKFRQYKNKSSQSKHCVIYLFAGGFIEGDLDSQDSICRYITDKTHLDVIAISYRLAPENKFPVAHDDAFEAIKYILTNYQYVSYTLFGYSSGGNLALSACTRMLKESVKEFAKINNLILVAPLINLQLDSSHQIDDVMLDIADIDYLIRAYTSGVKVDLKSPTISPFFEKPEILKCLPRTLILSMAYDPLSFDCYEFYRKLLGLGVECEFHEYPMIHLEFSLSASLLKDLTDNPLEDICQRLKSR